SRTQVRGFVVLPALPEPIQAVRELAYNLWWTWNPEAIELFRRLDLDLWRELRHNPVMMLSRLKQERLDRLARDPAYISSLNRMLQGLDIYIKQPTWFDETYRKEIGRASCRERV